MKTYEYIRGEITRHLDIYKITYRENQIAEMVESVLSGTGAFQIIFEQVFDPFGEDAGERYFLERWKSLDRKLVLKIGQIYGTTMHFTYSYDGGKRYQWSEMETILIDLEALREIKLKNLGI
jgi:hypothetical protein